MIDKAQIVSTLLANPAVSAVIGSRLYTTTPPTRPTDTYGFLSIVSDVPVGGENEVASRTRLELRIIGKDQETTYDSVKTVYLALENALMTTNVF